MWFKSLNGQYTQARQGGSEVIKKPTFFVFRKENVRIEKLKSLERPENHMG